MPMIVWAVAGALAVCAGRPPVTGIAARFPRNPGRPPSSRPGRRTAGFSPRRSPGSGRVVEGPPGPARGLPGGLSAWALRCSVGPRGRESYEPIEFSTDGRFLIALAARSPHRLTTILDPSTGLSAWSADAKLLFHGAFDKPHIFETASWKEVSDRARDAGRRVWSSHGNAVVQVAAGGFFIREGPSYDEQKPFEGIDCGFAGPRSGGLTIESSSPCTRMTAGGLTSSRPGRRES